MPRATLLRSCLPVKLWALSSSATLPIASHANGRFSHLPLFSYAYEARNLDKSSLTLASLSSLPLLLAHTVLMVASTVCFRHLLRIASFSVLVLVVNILPDLSAAPRVLASSNLVLATDGSSGSPTWQSMQGSWWLHLFLWLWYLNFVLPLRLTLADSVHRFLLLAMTTFAPPGVSCSVLVSFLLSLCSTCDISCKSLKLTRGTQWPSAKPLGCSS
jgi:hypothetical protein